MLVTAVGDRVVADEHPAPHLRRATRGRAVQPATKPALHLGHAPGVAVDPNPRENPYVGCGRRHDPTARSDRDRSSDRRVS